MPEVNPNSVLANKDCPLHFINSVFDGFNKPYAIEQYTDATTILNNKHEEDICKWG